MAATTIALAIAHVPVDALVGETTTVATTINTACTITSTTIDSTQYMVVVASVACAAVASATTATTSTTSIVAATCGLLFARVVVRRLPHTMNYGCVKY